MPQTPDHQPGNHRGPLAGVTLRDDTVAVGEATPAATVLLDPSELLETLGDGVIVADDGGTVRALNRAAEDLLGWRREDLVGQPLVTIVPERLRADHADGFRRYLTTREPRLIGRTARVPAVRRDGVEIEVELRLNVLVTGADHRELFLASLRDITDQVELEHELRLTRYLRASSEVTARLGTSGHVTELAQAAPYVLAAIGESLGWPVGALWEVDPERDALVCADVWHADGVDVTAFTQASFEMQLRSGVGIPGRVFETGRPVFVSDVTEDRNFPRLAIARAAGLHAAFAFPVLTQAGAIGVVEFYAPDLRPPDDDLLVTCTTIGRQIGQFIERQRVERAAQQRLAFLARAGELLESSLDLDTAMRAVARIATPFLADATAVECVTSDGERHCAVAAVRADGSVQVDGTVVAGGPRGPHGSAARLTPRVYARLDPLGWEAALDRDPVATPLRDLGAHSVAVVTLPTRGRVTGAVALGAVRAERAFTAELLTLAEDLSRRASLSIDNAHLFGQQSYIARRLQESLLPQALRSVPHADVAVQYVAAGAGMDVGGDFYDVIAGDGTWTFLVGDVCGKGVEAAAAAGLVRHTARALSLRGDPPARLAAELNEAMLRDEATSRFCTVVLGELRPRPGQLDVRFVCAGHPLPVLVPAGGEPRFVGAPGELLGAIDGAVSAETELRLGPGDVLVLYTDGVTERRSGGEFFGERRLLAVLAETAGGTAEEIAGALTAAVVEYDAEPPRDDLAVLVVRAAPTA